MNLQLAINQYIIAQQNSGRRYEFEASTLYRFRRIVGDISAHEINPEMINNFVETGRHGKLTASKYQATLNGFFRWYAIRIGENLNHLMTPVIQPKRTCIPYIYSRQELREMFHAAEKLNSSYLSGKTCKAFFLTLYCCGLRVREGINLRCKDVEFNEGAINIIKSKFGKSRRIPIENELKKFLQQYLIDRMQSINMPERDGSSLFPDSSGQYLELSRIEHFFDRNIRPAIARTGIRMRIHDIRHSFAVHTLLRCYTAGQNVQTLLPHLSGYLGHRDLRGTQFYITMTPELLNAASYKFLNYFEQGISK